jgi:hypothetical protein
MNTTPTRSLPAVDLFVVLERAYRRRARNCAACGFSLPFHTDYDGNESNWSIILSSGCCGVCKLILEDLVAEHQASYRLSGTIN